MKSYCGLHFPLIGKQLDFGLTDAVDLDDLVINPENHQEGITKDFHVTLLYGLVIHESEVKEILDKARNFKFGMIIPTELEIFETEDSDVLVLKIDSDKCREFNKWLNENYPSSQTFKEYNPHITLAYFKKGIAKKYKDGIKLPQGLELKPSIFELTLSPDKIKFKLKL